MILIYIFSWIPGQVQDGGGVVSDGYSVYPSPIFSGGKLKLSEPLRYDSEIYDVSGKLIRRVPGGVEEIDVSGFSPGVYFLISDDKRIRIKFVVF